MMIPSLMARRVEANPRASLRELLPRAAAIAGCDPVLQEHEPLLYAAELPHRMIVARREAWRALKVTRAVRAQVRARPYAAPGTGGAA